MKYIARKISLMALATMALDVCAESTKSFRIVNNSEDYSIINCETHSSTRENNKGNRHNDTVKVSPASSEAKNKNDHINYRVTHEDDSQTYIGIIHCKVAKKIDITALQDQQNLEISNMIQENETYKARWKNAEILFIDNAINNYSDIVSNNATPNEFNSGAVIANAKNEYELLHPFDLPNSENKINAAKWAHNYSTEITAVNIASLSVEIDSKGRMYYDLIPFDFDVKPNAGQPFALQSNFTFDASIGLNKSENELQLIQG